MCRVLEYATSPRLCDCNLTREQMTIYTSGRLPQRSIILSQFLRTIQVAEMNLHISAPLGCNQLGKLTRSPPQELMASNGYSFFQGLQKHASFATVFSPFTPYPSSALPFQIGSLLESNGWAGLTRTRTSTTLKEPRS